MKPYPLRRFVCAWPALLLLLPASTFGAPVTLAVANSTCTVMKEVGELYRRDNAVELAFICKSSGRLAKGLRGGAIEADVYLSANRRWMDFMIDNGLVVAERVVSPWGNALVVAAPNGSPLRFDGWEDLAGDKVTSVLIGDPGTAPFGRYAKQALEHTGLWARVREKVATRKHITLLADSLAEADSGTVGILFKTNLNGRLRALLPLDPAWHPPARYYLAPVGGGAPAPEVAELIDFIQGPVATERFRAAGCDVDPRP